MKEVEYKLEVVASEVSIRVVRERAIVIERKCLLHLTTFLSVSVIPANAEATAAAISCKPTPTALLHPAAVYIAVAIAYIAGKRYRYREGGQLALGNKAPSVCTW